MNKHARIEHGVMRRRAVEGVFWSYVAYSVQFAVQAIALVVLARQLSVTDFGIFAIGLMIVGIGETVFRMGLGPSLVQLDELRDEHIDVAWTCNLALALLSTTLLATGTIFFVIDPATQLATLVMLTSVLLNSVMSPGLLLLQRNMQTRDFVTIATVRVLVRYLGAVVAAIWIRNYWALIIGFVGGFAVEVAMTYAVARRAPRLLWRHSVFVELFRFARWFHLKNIVRWGSQYLDSVAVGALLGVPALGLYNRALNLAALPNQQAQLLGFRVFFPMFASAQKQPERLARLVGHALNVLLLTTVPVLLIMMLHGKLLIGIVLGEQWSAADSLLGLLALGLVVRSINDLHGTALRAVGESRCEFLMSMLQVAFTGLTLAPCILWCGLTGAPLALIFGSLAGVLLSEKFIRERLGARFGSQLQSIGGAAIGALAAVGVHQALGGSATSVVTETLRAAAELAAFFAVQMVIFVVTGGGVLGTLHSATRHFLTRHQRPVSAPMQPQVV